MRHSERAMQTSLEAANNHATSLQHRLAQVVAESSRLHQLLFDTQQCLEGIKAEKSILTGKLSELENQSKKMLLLKKQVCIYMCDGDVICEVRNYNNVSFFKTSFAFFV